MNFSILKLRRGIVNTTSSTAVRKNSPIKVISQKGDVNTPGRIIVTKGQVTKEINAVIFSESESRKLQACIEKCCNAQR